jgi:uncharacterized protein YegP (UPF0339 family)
MIDFDNPPTMARDYRGTIEVYPQETVQAEWSEVEVASQTEWRWRCRSKNSQIIGRGEGYTRKVGALNAVEVQYGSRLTDYAQRCLHGITRSVVPWRLVIFDRDSQAAKIGALY